VGADTPWYAPGTRVPGSRTGRIALALAVIGWFACLSFVFTRPIAAHAAERVAGQPGDNLYFVWLFDWYERAIFELHQSPLFDPWLNFPDGWSLASTQLPQAMVGLGLPLSVLAGPVAAYNFSALASFFLSGVLVYLYFRRWTGATLPALLAGTLFGFAPYRQAHFLIGHLDMLGTFWPALYVLSLIDICLGRGRSFWASAALCLSLFATGLTSPYYLYMSLLLTPVIVITFGLRGNLGGQAARRVRHTLAVGGALSVPLLVIAIWPYLELARSGTIGERSREYVRLYSASPTDYIIPSTTSMIWAPWVSAHFDRDLWVEGTLYLGAVGSSLAILALARRPRLGERGSQVAIVALTVGAFAFLLSLGTDLNWLSNAVRVPVPEFARAWHPTEYAHVPLPGRLLFEFLPLYSSMRVPMRFGLFVILAVSLLAGLGAGQTTSSVRHPMLRAGVACLWILLVVADFIPNPVPTFEVRPRAVDLWLRDQPGDGAVAQFPFYLQENQAHVYYTSIHRKPFLGGMFNAFPPSQYQRIRPIMDKFPDEESIRGLRDLQVEFVILHAASYSGFAEVEAWILQSGLCAAIALEGEHVYTWCE
jgi:hypothetical protein